MTEVEWLACNDPERMLEFLKGKASDRKLRYFLVACARRVLPASPDDDMIEALAVAERFADGLESQHRLSRIRSSLKTRHAARVSRWSPLYSTHIRSVPAWHATREQLVRAAREGSACCAWSSTRKLSFGGLTTMTFPREELTAQACLLRDIFGNPFRPVSLDHVWLTWNEGIIPELAKAVYGDRAFDRLPFLADALEEAGCTNADLLAHCRTPGPHTRGCWAVDLVLGRD
jgi:hypothetical protein